MSEMDTRCAQYRDGQRNAAKWAITFLHNLARDMNDPDARAILHGAAFAMGLEYKRERSFGNPPKDLSE